MTARPSFVWYRPTAGCVPTPRWAASPRVGPARATVPGPGPSPTARREQRDVDGGRFAGALAVEQRAHDPAGDRHGADRVAEAGGGRHGYEVVLGALRAEGDARAGPERERVVRALVGVGPALALAGASHVDDVRVLGADLVDVDLELGAHARQLVGEEHVGRGGQLVEDVEAVVRGEVEAEAALAAVRVLEQHVHVARDRGHTRRLESAHRVAALDVLDLDDLGAPVGEECRRRGHERVLRDLEDADAVQDRGHRWLPRSKSTSVLASVSRRATRHPMRSRAP